MPSAAPRLRAHISPAPLSRLACGGASSPAGRAERGIARAIPPSTARRAYPSEFAVQLLAARRVPA